MSKAGISLKQRGNVHDFVVTHLITRKKTVSAS